ncbi:tetratricopeptide repeat protein [Thalassoroseus pseudoceratinae]|uniref:tetratricopeptide repeat protein n=1 Tax=Thalassoroseus pseudoceratinae TaxID=2713176 RepID=UPI00141F360D|nr:tetratricopeptide repeat protein [Thalassoroseus pseudoceratinae]
MRPIQPTGRILRTRSVIATVLLLNIALSVPVVYAQSAIEIYNAAAGFYRQERWKLAAESFGEFADKNPKHVQAETARLYQGLSLTNAEDYKAARPIWKKFVKEFPKSERRPDALYRIAECSYMVDDFPNAEQDFKEFLKDHPKHELAEWAWPFLGETELELDKPTDAIVAYKTAVENFPKGRLVDEAQFGLAQAYEDAGQFDSAVETYQQVAQKPVPYLANQASFNLATILFDQENFAKAAETYDSLITKLEKDNPLRPLTTLNAGYAWYQLGDFRKAIEHFKTAAKEPSQTITAGYWRGVSHKSLGEHAEAARILEETFAAATKENSDAAPELIEKIRFHQADSRLRNEDFAIARDLFLELERRWPEGNYAADSLHLAAEAALRLARETTDEKKRATQLAEATTIADRFSTKYPDSPLSVQHELLYGRILDLKGGKDNLQSAVDRFQAVLDGAATDETKNLARFHLCRVLQKLKRHEEVLTIAEPLLEEVRQTGASSEFISTLIIAAQSHLAEKNDDQAIAKATTYLELAPKGKEADLALAARVVAATRKGDKDQVRIDLAALRDRFPNSPLLAEKILESGEIAYDKQDWEFAEELYEMLVKLGSKTPQYSAGVSGLAWARFNQMEYTAAAADFRKYFQEFPDNELQAAEAAYMRGQCLQNADQLKDAVQAYQTAFKTFSPDSPAAKGEEKNGATRYAFLAGLLTARGYEKLDEPEKTDEAYKALLEKFPNAEDLDKLLDEWALSNLRAGREAESDAVYRRLIQERPDSDLVDNAKLSLAESDFIAGKLEDAATAFEALLQNEKSDPEVREHATYRLMEIAVSDEDWETVKKYASQIEQKYPQSPYRFTAKFRTSEALLSEQKLDEAQKFLLELKDQQTNEDVSQSYWYPRVWVLLAETYLRQKDYDKVVETVAGFENWNPKSDRLYEVYEILGRAYKNQAEWDKARTAFERTLNDENSQGTETRAKAQLLIAETYWHQEKWLLAQKAYLQVYLVHKGYPEWQAPALYQAALCDEKLNQWNKAKETYEEVQAEFPTSQFSQKAAKRLKEIASRVTQ